MVDKRWIRVISLNRRDDRRTYRQEFGTKGYGCCSRNGLTNDLYVIESGV